MKEDRPEFWGSQQVCPTWSKHFIGYLTEISNDLIQELHHIGGLSLSPMVVIFRFWLSNLTKFKFHESVIKS